MKKRSKSVKQTPAQKKSRLLFLSGIFLFLFLILVLLTLKNVYPPRLYLGSLVSSIQSQPMQNMSEDMNTNRPTAVPTVVPEKTLVKRLGLKIDQRRFAITNKMIQQNIQNVRNEWVERIIIEKIDSTEANMNRQNVLTIEDVSSLSLPEIEVYAQSYNSIKDPLSTLRSVNISGKLYQFTRGNFGEGYPDQDNPECYRGGGVFTDYVIVEGGILVKLAMPYTFNGCGDLEPKNNVLSDVDAESLLRIIESIKL